MADRSGSTVVKRPTINDVADRAGVSIKTVSRVINREPNVRPATLQRVTQAIEALN
jgi:LacI family transcriptional regulator